MDDKRRLRIQNLFNTYKRRNQLDDMLRLPELSLNDLVGKTISARLRMGNPRLSTEHQEYHVTLQKLREEHFPLTYPSPYLDILEFSDDSLLVTESWADGECAYYEHYYVDSDGRTVKHTNDLFRCFSEDLRSYAPNVTPPSLTPLSP